MPKVTLLDHTILSYNIAAIAERDIGDEDACLSFIGYYLYKSMKQCLEYQMEKCGICFSRKRDIGQLVQAAHQGSADIVITKYIESHSGMLSRWGAGVMGRSGCQIDCHAVKEALEGVSYFLDLVLKREGQHVDVGCLLHMDEGKE